MKFASLTFGLILAITTFSSVTPYSAYAVGDCPEQDGCDDPGYPEDTGGGAVVGGGSEEQPPQDPPPQDPPPQEPQPDFTGGITCPAEGNGTPECPWAFTFPGDGCGIFGCNAPPNSPPPVDVGPIEGPPSVYIPPTEPEPAPEAPAPQPPAQPEPVPFQPYPTCNDWGSYTGLGYNSEDDCELTYSRHLQCYFETGCWRPDFTTLIAPPQTCPPEGLGTPECPFHSEATCPVGGPYTAECPAPGFPCPSMGNGTPECPYVDPTPVPSAGPIPPPEFTVILAPEQCIGDICCPKANATALGDLFHGRRMPKIQDLWNVFSTNAGHTCTVVSKNGKVDIQVRAIVAGTVDATPGGATASVFSRFKSSQSILVKAAERAEQLMNNCKIGSCAGAAFQQSVQLMKEGAENHRIVTVYGARGGEIIGHAMTEVYNPASGRIMGTLSWGKFYEGLNGIQVAEYFGNFSGSYYRFRGTLPEYVERVIKDGHIIPSPAQKFIP